MSGGVQLSAGRDAGLPDGAKAHILDIELTEPLSALRSTSQPGSGTSQAWALVRFFGEPLGLEVLDIPVQGLSARDIDEILMGRYRSRLSEILGVAGDQLGETIQSLAGDTKSSPFDYSHAEFIRHAPRCSVIVCTKNRPKELHRCLTGLAEQDHPDFAVWVVDNDPARKAVEPIVRKFESKLQIHYLPESRSGLSRARNSALQEELYGDYVAWLDDDEIPDARWLGELMRAFHKHPEIVAASGAVVPAELQTAPQLWFEQFGGHSKGRGFSAEIFSPNTWGRQHPLYPLPPFGVGANMAFRVDALRAGGGFDEALGAGTPAQGAEDTKIFCDLMLAGGTVAYWPTALTRHFHRRDLEGLRRQMRGYGSGLTAFYTASVVARPSTVIDLARLAPRALRDLFSPNSLRVATLGDDFPRHLLRENRRGLVAGPWLYLRGRIQNRRTGRKPW